MPSSPSFRSMSLLPLVALLAGCASASPDEPANETRTVTGKLVAEQYPSVTAPRIAAIAANGTTFDAPVSADGTFSLSVPARMPLRMFVTDAKAPNAFVASSRVLWPGGAVWATLASTTASAGASTTASGATSADGVAPSIDLGTIRPVVAPVANAGATTATGGGAAAGSSNPVATTGDDHGGDGSGSGSGSSGSSSGSGSGDARDGNSTSTSGGTSGSGTSGSGDSHDGDSKAEVGEHETHSPSGDAVRVCTPLAQSTSVCSGSKSLGVVQRADLPYDAKLPAGWTYRLSDSFLEKGAYPAAILDVQMEKGGTWRLAELKADTAFVVTQADCSHAGTRDVGRDRALVTWRNADGSTQTDHIDMRYCQNDPPPHGNGIGSAPAPAAPAPSAPPISSAPAPTGGISMPGCEAP